MKTLDEVLKAVDEGKTVHWQNTGYVVKKDNLGCYLIIYKSNEYTTGIDPNDKPEDFFVA